MYAAETHQSGCAVCCGVPSCGRLAHRRLKQRIEKNEPDVSPGRLLAEIGGAAADEYRPDLVTELFNI